MISDKADNALQDEPSDTFGPPDNLRPKPDSDSDISRCSDMPYLEDDEYDAGLFLASIRRVFRQVVRLHAVNILLPSLRSTKTNARFFAMYAVGKGATYSWDTK